jgi:hypothetical protein
MVLQSYFQGGLRPHHEIPAGVKYGSRKMESYPVRSCYDVIEKLGQQYEISIDDMG